MIPPIVDEYMLFVSGKPAPYVEAFVTLAAARLIGAAIVARIELPEEDSAQWRLLHERY
jgi:hypothetical protein